MKIRSSVSRIRERKKDMFGRKGAKELDPRDFVKLLEKMETRIIKIDTRQQVLEKEIKDLKELVKKQGR